MNQSLIDEIVTNVLAKLQPSAGRLIIPAMKPQTAEQQASPSTVSVTSTAGPSQTVLSSSAAVELTSAVITADLLESAVRPGQTIKVGRQSILTPSARDWLHSKRISWSRLERMVGSKESSGPRTRWRMILQSVTPTVRALQDGFRRMSEGWKAEIVGQPLEAVTLATNLICTAESDGVVIFTEQAELIACLANRNERIRAAVMQNSKQWELVMQTLSANVVCINPIGRSLMELRNLLRDCVRK